MDYFAHAPQTRATLERLAREAPTTLACMHGSAWRGDGARLLRELAAALETRCAARAQRRAAGSRWALKNFHISAVASTSLRAHACTSPSTRTSRTSARRSLRSAASTTAPAGLRARRRRRSRCASPNPRAPRARSRATRRRGPRRGRRRCSADRRGRGTSARESRGPRTGPASAARPSARWPRCDRSSLHASSDDMRAPPEKPVA